MRRFILWSLIIAVSLLPYTLYSKIIGQKFQSLKGFLYDKAWEEVRKCDEKGLPKSSLKIIEEVHHAAAAEKNYGQLIKALIQRCNYMQRVEEDAFVGIQKLLWRELSGNAFPVKNILHSMIAEQYWTFYLQNRYRFLKRSAAVEFKNDDMRTWDLKKIVEEVLSHYHHSLDASEQLKKTPLNMYDVVLQGNKESRKVRPTLYDFLAHRAVDFFMNNEALVTRPAEQFTLNSADYFFPNNSFAKMTIATEDTFSFHYYAIKYLRDLTAFHVSDKDPDALIDVDLKRLGYVYSKTIIGDKDKVYEDSLRRMLERYKEYRAAGDIYYELARHIAEGGEKYDPVRAPDHQWHKKKAHDLCSEAIQRYPGASGSVNCGALKHELEGRTITVSMEETLLPDRPSLALVSYKNIDRLYFRIVATTRQELRGKQKVNNQEMVDYYTARTPLRKWEIALPNAGDYQGHSAEISVDGVGRGTYLLLVSNSPSFDMKEHAVAYCVLRASAIATIFRNQGDRGMEMQVMHRDSGAALTGAIVQTWYNEWNEGQKKYIEKQGPRFTADKNGEVVIPHNTLPNNSFNLEIIHGEDRLFHDRGYYSHHSWDHQSASIATFFFTDRSIYRPGQTVFFKGIRVSLDSRDGEKTAIMPNAPVAAVLSDVNGEKVSELNLATNEFGSFSGSFILPTGLLNGVMSISDGYSSIGISVEEYKRPTFEVGFLPADKQYRLNSPVEVKGTAMAYAGYPIDGVAVTYRVVRRVFYPYRWCFWGLYPPPAPETQIAQGAATTDAAGGFAIQFKALPDDTVEPSNFPAFRYAVTVDITDKNGETRSGEYAVYVGYSALVLQIGFPGVVDREGPPDLTINSTTLSGDFIEAAGSLEMYKLQTPSRVLRDKRWHNADIKIIGEQQYYRDFPNDIYNDENDVPTWKRETKVFSTSFNTKKQKSYSLKEMAGWGAGKYVIEMTSKDAFGNPVKEMSYFTLYASSEKSMPYRMLDWCTVTAGPVEPGRKAKVVIGSSEKEVQVLYEVEHRGVIAHREYITLNDEQKVIEIPIEEKHRGNLGVLLTFLKHNRVFTHRQVINVPWTNKELDVSFETFRNKLEPGARDEWRLRIKGRQGDAVAAEMVATLYDASLDYFKEHEWPFQVYPNHIMRYAWTQDDTFDLANTLLIGKLQESSTYWNKGYESLNWFNFYWSYGGVYNSRNGGRKYKATLDAEGAGEYRALQMEKKEAASDMEMAQAENAPAGPAAATEAGPGQPSTKKASPAAGVKARTNFNETAFFYPRLLTGKDGEVIISFTVPEALTRWKMLGFAHTRGLAYGFATNTLVTQKDLMVVPNSPRFLREKDSIVFTSKVTNISDNTLSGSAHLLLFDANTMKPVDDLFNNRNARQSFSASKGESALVNWKLDIPETVDAVVYRVEATAGAFSDGEEKPLPVLKNRMLVTETMPLPVRSKEKKEFTFTKLVESPASATLRNRSLTLEFTSNPAWYAVQALPYIMEYPYDCMEQTFSRYYANSIAAHIVASNPRIKKVFDIWASGKGGDALLSNLEKNQELKALLLQETPWVMNARDESERKRRIAFLFDAKRMSDELGHALKKIIDGQMASGAWPWFAGMKECRYITQHIVSGFAHLNALGVVGVRKNPAAWEMVSKGTAYLDRAIRDDYESLVRNRIKLSVNNLGNEQIQYLYARSYFTDIPMDARTRTAFTYYRGQAKKYWLSYNIYMQGMIALALHRWNDTKTAQGIVKSLKEHSLSSPEMGMYWKSSYGYYWYEFPVETQALLIEVFHEVARDRAAVDDMKTWLIKQKQTQDWKTTKATVDACYALLLQGDQWLAYTELAEITLGKMTIQPAQLAPVEAGTGYFKLSWHEDDVKPEMGRVTVVNKNPVPAWGALYWQYFEDLDKITPSETPLSLKRKLFVERPTASGPVLVPLDKTTIAVGDRIKVRIELRVDRTMEYVHMKDMRASCFEPENVLSQYKWQDGLGYYESTKDASTNFFFDYLPKGTYVFEYPLRTTHKGKFSNGITSIQCMYAPEFSSHSEGVRVVVE